jgi:predicted glycoside hydrolase/deacetylase ChbG (UPF0249 family)
MGKTAFGIVIALFIVLPLIAASGDIQLIVRGDDMGMTQGSLAAFEKSLNEGVLTCASILVPAPWFEGAAELARKNPGWCTGIHLGLIGEWRGYRWRPVLPWDQVRSLVDEDGYLYTSPDVLFAHRPKLQEIEVELRAQVALARKKGINVQYLDTHYVDLNGYPGLEDVIRRIAKDNDVPVSQTLGEKEIDVYMTPVADKLKAAVSMLEKLEPGLYMWMCHIGINSPEQRALIHTKPEDIFVDGGVGVHRAEELRVLTSLEVKSVILKKGIKLTTYRELWNARRK